MSRICLAIFPRPAMKKTLHGVCASLTSGHGTLHPPLRVSIEVMTAVLCLIHWTLVFWHCIKVSQASVSNEIDQSNLRQLQWLFTVYFCWLRSGDCPIDYCWKDQISNVASEKCTPVEWWSLIFTSRKGRRCWFCAQISGGKDCLSN